MIKQMTDSALAVVGLVVLAPIFAIIAVALWLDDRGGPILYRGPRVGHGGRSFHILKFRTMRMRVESGSAITVAADPRVTRIGRVLRASKLDELPQLLNVLRGDMSLVGPRPEAPVYVTLYTTEQLGVLAVRPGITGPTQIRFRHEERLLKGPDPEAYYCAVVMPAKVASDLEYIRNASYWGDLKLLVLTLTALVRPAQTPDLPDRSSLTPVGVSMRTLPAPWSERGTSEAVAVQEPGGGAA